MRKDKGVRGSSKAIAAIVGAVAALAIVVAAALWVFPILRVTGFDVEGNSHLDRATVEEATGVPIGANLMRVDARAAASGVAQLPWVDTVTVSRSFPSSLKIELSEQSALAFKQEGDGTELINSAGEGFVHEAPPEGAVEVTGTVDVGTSEMAQVAEVIAAVPPELRAQVESLEAKDAYSLTFKMRDGRTVFWGASQGDNANKARAFAAVLKMDGQNWNISNPELVTSRP